LSDLNLKFNQFSNSAIGFAGRTDLSIFETRLLPPRIALMMLALMEA
jgi:hypothetical protein